MAGAFALMGVFNPVARIADRAGAQADAGDIFASRGFMEFDPFSAIKYLKSARRCIITSLLGGYSS
jgi:hypothetical protein